MKYEVIANARLWKTLREAYTVAAELTDSAEEEERDSLHADHDTYQTYLDEAEDMREFAETIYYDAQRLEFSISEATKKPTKSSLARLHAAVGEVLSSTADGACYVPFVCDRLEKETDEVESHDITATALVDAFRAAKGERRFAYLLDKRDITLDIDMVLRETRKAIRHCCDTLTVRAVKEAARALAKLERHTNYEKYV